jgi:hypothetical protein
MMPMQKMYDRLVVMESQLMAGQWMKVEKSQKDLARDINMPL